MFKLLLFKFYNIVFSKYNDLLNFVYILNLINQTKLIYDYKIVLGFF